MDSHQSLCFVYVSFFLVREADKVQSSSLDDDISHTDWSSSQRRPQRWFTLVSSLSRSRATRVAQYNKALTDEMIRNAGHTLPSFISYGLHKQPVCFPLHSCLKITLLLLMKLGLFISFILQSVPTFHRLNRSSVCLVFLLKVSVTYKFDLCPRHNL